MDDQPKMKTRILRRRWQAVQRNTVDEKRLTLKKQRFFRLCVEKRLYCRVAWLSFCAEQRLTLVS
jgi:hypothetical protein